MSEWIDPAKRLPKDGQHVDILVGDRIVEKVLFQDRFFWKYRKGIGGHTYMVLSWRSLEKQIKKGERQIHGNAADSFTTSAENTD